MRSRERFVLLLTLAGVTGGCGGDRDTPTSPTPPVVPSSPFVGTWVGSIADSAAGSGTLRLTITDHFAISLVGSWASTFGDQSLNDNGPLSATVEGSNVRLILRGQFCDAPFGTTARLVIADAIVEGTRMAGSYISLGCGAPRDGRIDVVRQ